MTEPPAQYGAMLSNTLNWMKKRNSGCFHRITAPPFFCLQGLSQHHCCNDTRECDASVANPADSLLSPALGRAASEIWWINERLLMLIADIRLFRAPRQSLIYFLDVFTAFPSTVLISHANSNRKQHIALGERPWKLSFIISSLPPLLWYHP